jgi:peptidoglycan hydrolase-like protein with peptidoglycan-binding domain
MSAGSASTRISAGAVVVCGGGREGNVKAMHNLAVSVNGRDGSKPDYGAPDGLGKRTRQAIKRFQQRNGLDETGEVSIPLVTKLEHLTS